MPETFTNLDDANLFGLDHQTAKLGADIQHTLLWHDQVIAIRIIHGPAKQNKEKK
jgi:hypothetical protein